MPKEDGSQDHGRSWAAPGPRAAAEIFPGPPRAAEIFVVGASHRSCPAGIRERLAADEHEAAVVRARLKAAGLDQFVWLCTCDRVEVLAAHPDPAAAAAGIKSVLAERAGMPVAALDPDLYVLGGDDAVRHVFAVASSLDSQIVGEPQVLGQVKEAHREAAAAGLTGPEMEGLLQAAYAAAKKVRSETGIAERPVSIAAAAVQTARDVHGDLGRCTALLVGLGDMGLLMLDALREAGLGRVMVAARSALRAEVAARRLGGHWIEMDALDTALPGADIVVTAVGLGRYILSPKPVAAALRTRRSRPVFVIDAGVPCDVDPDVGRLDDAFVYDLVDLEGLAMAGRAGREAAAEAAWERVEAAVAAFARSRAERSAVPAVTALRRHFEEMRDRLLEEQPGLDAAEATRLLVGRLLHQPSEVLRGLAAVGEATEAERLLGRLFRLDENELATGPAGDRREGEGS